MPRLRLTWAMTLAGMLIGIAPAFGQNDEAPANAGMSRELRFLQGLRERGYHDLALEYLDRLRKAPDTPADLKAILDYEEGRGLLDEASGMADLERRAAQFDQARIKLDAFTKANANHPLAPEALVQLARLNFLRAQNAVLQSNELKTPAEKQPKLAEARAAFAQARNAYAKALAPLKAAFEAFPKFLPNDDPRLPKRKRAHDALMDAELQRALVDYEEAQTYEPKAGERAQLLSQAQAAFNTTYKNYRTQLAGLFARLWEAKCYEEKGELGPAMGIYKELREHDAPELRGLRRKVAYFQIIIDGKRGEHALAVDQANEWLKEYNNYRNSEEGLGVQLELAKNILAQLENFKDSEKEAAIRTSTELLQTVVRVYSPFKPEALALLQKYKPKATVNASAIASMNFDNAYSQAEGAVSSHEWNQAIALLRQAIRRAEVDKKIENLNKARYLLAFTDFSSERYYDAAVLGEHLARNYPKGGLSAKAAEIAIASLAAAYSNYTQIDRTADLDHLIALCSYTAETWSDSDQADFARNLIGEIEFGRGRYLEAAKAYESIRANSPRRLDSQVKAGDCHWREGLNLRDRGKDKEADAESAKALDLLQAALKARRDAGAAPTDPGLLTNINALAEVHRASGRPKEALALLEPASQMLASATLTPDAAPLVEKLLTTQLKTHLANGQSDKAIADMKALEKAGSAREKLTQLYFQLSMTLQKEMEAQKSKNSLAYQRTQQAFKQFLNALASSDAGQDFNSLAFAGESMLNLGMANESASVFEKLVSKYEKDAEFQKSPNAHDRLLRAKLRWAEALRKQRNFSAAQKLVDSLAKDEPRAIEVKLEQGYLYNDWAKAEPARWDAAFKYWRKMATQLERVRALRNEYYEAVYNVAVCLQGLSQKDASRKDEALKTLRGIIALSPTVGKPEMKKKYEDLIKQLTR